MEPLAEEVRGYGISMKMAVVWQIRQSRLHQTASESLEFNLKLDGRPLAGILSLQCTYYIYTICQHNNLLKHYNSLKVMSLMHAVIIKSKQKINSEII